MDDNGQLIPLTNSSVFTRAIDHRSAVSDICERMQTLRQPQMARLHIVLTRQNMRGALAERNMCILRSSNEYKLRLALSAEITIAADAALDKVSTFVASTFFFRCCI